MSSLAPARSALDLGCGDGRLTGAIPAPEVTAADVSLTALKRARARAAPATVILLSVERALPFPDDAFDLVVCADALEHMLDLQRALSEVRRVLTPGGRLALCTPELGRRTALTLARGGTDPRFDPLGPPVRHFTRDSLLYVLELAGFALESLGTGAGRLLVVAAES